MLAIVTETVFITPRVDKSEIKRILDDVDMSHTYGFEPNVGRIVINQTHIDELLARLEEIGIGYRMQSDASEVK